MATVKQFEDLKVWQEARRMVDVVYTASKVRAFARDFALREQIRRAAISTMSNIAEGFERGSRKEFIQFRERLKKSCSQCGARIFGFWRGFGEGAGLINPVTEPKRSQNPKRPLLASSHPHGYRFSENALTIAKGSNGEVRSQLHVALDQKYLTETQFSSLREAAMALSKQLASFIRYLDGYAGDSRVKKPARARNNLQPSTSNV